MRRLDNIDLRLLRVFVTLAEAGGFADAQIVLNLSSSTLSTAYARSGPNAASRKRLRSSAVICGMPASMARRGARRPGVYDERP